MAIGHGKRPTRGGMPQRGNRGGFGSKPVYSPKPVSFSSPAAFGAPVSPVNINIGNTRVKHSSGGGLLGSLLGSAVSAGVGVASAAIVNKIHENSQIKIAEKQAEQQAEFARQQAEQQAAIARQQAEYQVEIEKLKVQQAEVRLDEVQDKRYFANCPYCMGVNNGDKFCRYCGSSLAYYDEDEEDDDNRKKEA